MELAPTAELGEQLPTAYTVWYINSRSTDAPLLYANLAARHANQDNDAAEWIPTTGDGACIDRLKKEIEQRQDLEIIIGGGDGTVHAAVKALVGLPPEMLQDKNIIISVVGLGYKSDVAHMLHGGNYRDIGAILEGPPRPVRPLLIQRRTSYQEPDPATGEAREAWGWESVDAAVYSFGMAATADGAEAANGREFRKRNGHRPESALGKLAHRAAQRWADVRLGLATLRASAELEPHGRVADVTAANGNLMAGDLRFPATLDEAGFFFSVTRRGITMPLNMLVNFSDRLAGLGYSGVFVHGAHYFEITETTKAHVDGEIITLLPGLYKISEGPALQFRSAKQR